MNAESIFQRHALATTAARRVTTGRGFAIGHHGEILQGVVRGADGQLHRALVTLPCTLCHSEATFTPDRSGRVKVDPPGLVKARAATELALARLGRTDWGGILAVRNNMPPRWGFGSSTSDVVAAVRAVAGAFECSPSSERLALLAVQAEVASDPTMFGAAAVLFAQREGVVLEYFGLALPALEVLGFNTDPVGVDTLCFGPAEYDWWEVEAFRPLLGLLRKGILNRDARLVGRVASASARINQKHLPTRFFDRLERLAEEVEAVGLQVAHSGTLVGFLFDAADRRVESLMQYARHKLRDLGIEHTWRFQTGDADEWSSTAGHSGESERGTDHRGRDRAAAYRPTDAEPLRGGVLLDEAVSSEVHPRSGAR